MLSSQHLPSPSYPVERTPPSASAHRTADVVLAMQRSIGTRATRALLDPARRRRLQRFPATHEHTADAPPALHEAWRRAGEWLRLCADVRTPGNEALRAFFPAHDIPTIRRDIRTILAQWTLMNERGREGEYRLAEGQDRRLERDSVGYRYVTTTGGSAVARTQGRGAEALITVFPEGVASGEVALTRTIVHELSHASGLETEDVAYQGTPLFNFLNVFPGSAGAPPPARRNADSYAHAVASLVAREDPAQTTRVDPAKPPTGPARGIRPLVFRRSGSLPGRAGGECAPLRRDQALNRERSRLGRRRGSPRRRRSATRRP